MSAEEELANYKQELGCALKERNALRDILRVASKEDVSDDVDEYLASVILSRQRVDELSKLNARIDFITDVLLDQLD